MLEAHIEIERRPIDKNVHALVRQLLRGALLAHLKHKRANLWHLDKQVEDSFVFQQIHTQIQVGNACISVCDGMAMPIVVPVDEMHPTPRLFISLSCDGGPVTPFLPTSHEQTEHTRAQAQRLPW